MTGTSSAPSVPNPYSVAQASGSYAISSARGNKITAKKRGDYSDTGIFAGAQHYENGKLRK